jgi:hypothetical protein
LGGRGHRVFLVGTQRLTIRTRTPECISFATFWRPPGRAEPVGNHTQRLPSMFCTFLLLCVQAHGIHRPANFRPIDRYLPQGALRHLSRVTQLWRWRRGHRLVGVDPLVGLHAVEVLL